MRLGFRVNIHRVYGQEVQLVVDECLCAGIWVQGSVLVIKSCRRCLPSPQSQAECQPLLASISSTWTVRTPASRALAETPWRYPLNLLQSPHTTLVPGKTILRRDDVEKFRLKPNAKL